MVLDRGVPARRDRCGRCDAVAAVVRAAQIGDTQGDQGPWKKARGPGRGAEASRLDVDDTDTVSTP